MQKISRIIILVLFALAPLTSFGWGVLGHRITGQIAWNHLTPKAKLRITKILGTESLALATTWADFIRSDSSYSALSSWHFIDFDSSASAADIRSYLKTDTATDLYTKTKFIIGQLKGHKLSADKQRYYLKLLIHFVGDIHQPLHVGEKNNAGGNKIKVNWFNTPVNLHSIWDESLINFQQLSYTEYTAAIDHSTAAERHKWEHTPMTEWFVESFLISQQVTAEVTPDAKLSYRYNFDHIATINQRLLIGGLRLATLLNDLFGY
ncbi:MAG TPA: S1/P1 nuclease [Chitinophagaceae bacterium]